MRCFFFLKPAYGQSRLSATGHFHTALGTNRTTRISKKERHAKNTGNESPHLKLSDKTRHYVFFKPFSCEGKEKKINQNNWLACG